MQKAIGSTLLLISFFVIAGCASRATFLPGSTSDAAPDRAARPEKASADSPWFVPLDPQSPWPKFKANSIQTSRIAPGNFDAAARTDVLLDETTAEPWVFHTGRGIFSPPVVDAEGTVYVGSADHRFYAIDKDGIVKWSYLTGGIIDSAALLDDMGRVYVPGADGKLYALDVETGEVVWIFAAHEPEQLESEKGVESMINWFEGHVAMDAEGTLVVPNDNHMIYGVDRLTGEEKWRFATRDMNWSLPAYNPSTARWFAGSVYVAFRNFHAFSADAGERIWSQGALGSMVSSPMLTSPGADAAVISAGFDGFVRSFDPHTGRVLWKFAARDHIYASPAQLSDGTIVIPSTDGSIYALDPHTGKPKWTFDTLEPIRSTPAVDSGDGIYVGSGEGRLYCLNPDGTLRWSYLAITGERNDLNSSPALGHEAVYVAGENGDVVRVPYEYPSSPTGYADPRVILPESGSRGESLPDDGVHVLTIGPFGNLMVEPPESIDRNRSLTFTILVRSNADTVPTTIDAKRLSVRVEPKQRFRVDPGANGRYFTVIPEENWKGVREGETSALRISVTGEYRTGHLRFGLKRLFGKRSGGFAEWFSFALERPADESIQFPYQAFDSGEADTHTVFDLGRLAAPVPSILPSYNQMGFDSIHYLMGLGRSGGRYFTWGVEGRLNGETGEVEIDPSLNTRFVLDLELHGDFLNLTTGDGFTLKLNGRRMPYELFRAATRIDRRTGEVLDTATINAIVATNEISFYGPFLKLLGFSHWRTGMMNVAGAADIRAETRSRPEWLFEAGSYSVRREGDLIVAIAEGSSLRAEDHVFGIMLTDGSDSAPLALDYARNTDVVTNENGEVIRVILDTSQMSLPESLRAWCWVDTFAIARDLAVE